MAIDNATYNRCYVGMENGRVVCTPEHAAEILSFYEVNGWHLGEVARRHLLDDIARGERGRAHDAKPDLAPGDGASLEKYYGYLNDAYRTMLIGSPEERAARTQFNADQLLRDVTRQVSNSRNDLYTRAFQALRGAPDRWNQAIEEDE